MRPLLVKATHEHGAVGVVHDGSGAGAEDSPLEGALAPRAHDDEVGLLSLRQLADLLPRLLALKLNELVRHLHNHVKVINKINANDIMFYLVTICLFVRLFVCCFVLVLFVCLFVFLLGATKIAVSLASEHQCTADLS